MPYISYTLIVMTDCSNCMLIVFTDFLSNAEYPNDFLLKINILSTDIYFSLFTGSFLDLFFLIFFIYLTCKGFFRNSAWKTAAYNKFYVMIFLSVVSFYFFYSYLFLKLVLYFNMFWKVNFFKDCTWIIYASHFLHAVLKIRLKNRFV